MLKSRASVAALAVLAVTGAVAVVPAPHGNTVARAAPRASNASPWSNIGPPGGYVQSVAFDPKTPTTVYAGLESGGVFKSTNGGSSWASAGLKGTEINAIAVDPTSPSTVYIGDSYGGLDISTNAGASWSYNSKLGPVGVNALAVDPNNGSILYVATPGNGIYKTTDAGASWTAVDSGLTNSQVNDVVVAPSSPTTLYAATPSGVFTSTDSGSSWSAIDSGLTDTDDQSVAVDPSNPSNLWAADIDNPFQQLVYHSTNGGTSWTPDATGIPPAPSTLFAQFNVPLIVTASTVFVGIEGSGLYSEPVSGSSWTSAAADMTDPDGLATANVYALAVDPASATTMLAGTEDGGVFKTTNGASSWSAENSGLFGNGIIALAGVPTNENMIYAATEFLGLFVSSNGGKTWASAKATDEAQIQTITVDPNTPSTVWAAGSGIYKTTDNGVQWTRMSGFSASGTVLGIAVDPFDSAIVYAATLGDGVYETPNAGTTWSAVNTGLTNLDARAIAADPATKGLLYVGTEDSGVFTSTNGGSSWTQMPTTGLPSTDITSILDPPGSVVVGTESGVVALEKTKWAGFEFRNLDDSTMAVTSCYVKEKTTYEIFPIPKQPRIYYVHVYAYCAQGAFELEQPVGASWSLPFRQFAGPLTLSPQDIFSLAFGGEPLLLLGTIGNDIYALPSSMPIFAASAESKTATGSATATVPSGQSADTAGSLSTDASKGKGTVTIDDYFTDPSSVQTPFLPSNFSGVSLSSGNTFKSVAIEDCQFTDSKTMVEWLDGTKWVKASKQAYEKASGCVSVTVNATTSPAVKHLTAVVFASTG